jgi:hypothetical protein
MNMPVVARGLGVNGVSALMRRRLGSFNFGLLKTPPHLPIPPF